MDKRWNIWVHFLNDFRWVSKLIAWKEILLFLERQGMDLPSAKKPSQKRYMCETWFNHIWNRERKNILRRNISNYRRSRNGNDVSVLEVLWVQEMDYWSRGKEPANLWKTRTYAGDRILREYVHTTLTTYLLYRKNIGLSWYIYIYICMYVNI